MANYTPIQALLAESRPGHRFLHGERPIQVGGLNDSVENARIFGDIGRVAAIPLMLDGDQLVVPPDAPSEIAGELPSGAELRQRLGDGPGYTGELQAFQKWYGYAVVPVAERLRGPPGVTVVVVAHVRIAICAVVWIERSVVIVVRIAEVTGTVGVTVVTIIADVVRSR